MLVLFVAVILVAALVIFSAQNAAPVAVTFLVWHFTASLAVILFMAVALGIVVAMLVTLTLRVKKARRRKQLREATSARPDDKGPNGPESTSLPH